MLVTKIVSGDQPKNLIPQQYRNNNLTRYTSVWYNKNKRQATPTGGIWMKNLELGRIDWMDRETTECNIATWLGSRGWNQDGIDNEMEYLVGFDRERIIRMVEDAEDR